MSQPFLSIIIPAKNEALRLPRTLADIERHLSETGMDAEVLVVEDGSTDDTVQLVTRYCQTHPYCVLIGGGPNRGKGWAVTQGMMAAAGEWRLFMDADNSTALDQLDMLRPALEGGCPIVIGSRAVPGARLTPPQGFLKQTLGRLGNLLIRALVLPGIRDTQCGFKVFTAEAAREIFPRIRVDGWGFDVEALVIARMLGFEIQECPIRWINDPRSQVGGRAYLSTLLDVLRIRWWSWRGTYLTSLTRPAPHSSRAA